jgi:heme oxygenase
MNKLAILLLSICPIYAAQKPAAAMTDFDDILSSLDDLAPHIAPTRPEPAIAPDSTLSSLDEPTPHIEPAPAQAPTDDSLVSLLASYNDAETDDFAIAQKEYAAQQAAAASNPPASKAPAVYKPGSAVPNSASRPVNNTAQFDEDSEPVPDISSDDKLDLAAFKTTIEGLIAADSLDAIYIARAQLESLIDTKCSENNEAFIILLEGINKWNQTHKRCSLTIPQDKINQYYANNSTSINEHRAKLVKVLQALKLAEPQTSTCASSSAAAAAAQAPTDHVFARRITKRTTPKQKLASNKPDIEQTSTSLSNDTTIDVNQHYMQVVAMLNRLTQETAPNQLHIVKKRLEEILQNAFKSNSSNLNGVLSAICQWNKKHTNYVIAVSQDQIKQYYKDAVYNDALYRKIRIRRLQTLEPLIKELGLIEPQQHDSSDYSIDVNQHAYKLKMKLTQLIQTTPDQLQIAKPILEKTLQSAFDLPNGNLSIVLRGIIDWNKKHADHVITVSQEKINQYYKDAVYNRAIDNDTRKNRRNTFEPLIKELGLTEPQKHDSSDYSIDINQRTHAVKMELKRLIQTTPDQLQIAKPILEKTLQSAFDLPNGNLSVVLRGLIDWNKKHADHKITVSQEKIDQYYQDAVYDRAIDSHLRCYRHKTLEPLIKELGLIEPLQTSAASSSSAAAAAGQSTTSAAAQAPQDEISRLSTSERMALKRTISSDDSDNETLNAKKRRLSSKNKH